MAVVCAKCGSERIVPLASVRDQGQHSDGKLRTEVYTNPEAWIFKGTVSATLRARVCGECGFTELYAEHPKALHDAWRKSSGRSRIVK